MYISWIFLCGTFLSSETPASISLEHNKQTAPIAEDKNQLPSPDALPAPSNLPTIEDGKPPPPNSPESSNQTEPSDTQQVTSSRDQQQSSPPNQAPPTKSASSSGVNNNTDFKSNPNPSPTTRTSGNTFQYHDSPSKNPNSLQWAESPQTSPQFQYTEAPQNRDAIKWSSEEDLQSKAAANAPDIAITDHSGASIFTPRQFGLEIKMGPYRPNFDRNCPSTSKQCTPYRSIFGKKNGLLVVLGFDWQFLNLAGPLSIGTSVGLWRDSAPAPFRFPLEMETGTESESETETETGKSETDVVTFNIVPISLLVGYRLEIFANKYHVPLVPFVKGGLTYGIYWSGDSNERVSTSESGKRFEGGSLGGQIEMGAMLQIDGIEPGASKKLEQNLGIRHVYVFGEYMLSRMDGFQKPQKVSVGGNTWLAGLAFEF